MKHLSFLKLAREEIARDVMRRQLGLELPEAPVCLVCGAWVPFERLRPHLETELREASGYSDEEIQGHFLVLSER